MSCKCKNKNYKSALQYFNTTNQAIAITDIITSPVVIDLGVTVLDTGCAFDFESNSINVEFSGLYQFINEISVIGTITGDITFAMLLDGSVIPESLRTITVEAGSSYVVPISDIKKLNTCCNINDHTISLIAYSNGVAGATITRISGNAVKLA